MGVMQMKKSWTTILSFLGIQIILYVLILTSGGKLLIWSEYTSIVLCFLFAVLHFKDLFIVGGLAMTLCADYFLVICDPMRQLWGMVFFLAAQTFYAVKLHRHALPWGFLVARVVLTVGVIAVSWVILGENADALALVSMAYYANLIWNMVCAFVRFREDRLLAIGFALFILCDTVIGLQVAAGGYLPIAEGSLLHRIIFPGFHLSWVFYLPSQVLIALSAQRDKSAAKTE